MHAPALMCGMAEAVRRIRHAIAAGENIAVYGDFDVDGVTGTVLLHQILSAFGAHCQVYVPHRRSEGYGLNKGALDRLHADGVSLIVTVDCGISCADEVEYARGIGIDVIITDHHLPPSSYPTLSPSLIRISRAAPTHLRSWPASASPSSWPARWSMDDPMRSACAATCSTSSWSARSRIWCPCAVRTACWCATGCRASRTRRARACARCCAAPAWSTPI